jgi:hypothetical protein
MEVEEELPASADLTGGSKQATTTTPFYLALDHTASARSSPPPAEAPPLPCATAANSERGSEIIKAKIMSHPLYPAVLRAFIDCRKVCVQQIFQRHTILQLILPESES